MKILLATFWSIPHVGGVWNYMKQLKERLETFGHEVDLLGFGEGNNYLHIVPKKQLIKKNHLLQIITKIQKQSDTFCDEAPLLNEYEMLRYCFELGAAYFDLKNYDLIHTQDVLSTACMNRIRPQGTPLVASLHGSVAKEIKQIAANIYSNTSLKLVNDYFDKLEYNGATAADITLVANNWLKDMLTNEFRVPPEQLEVLHYGYDIDTFLKKMDGACLIQTPVDKKVIFFAGRLVGIKGVHHLINALGQLKKLRNDWFCWIAGDGGQKEQLQQRSNVLGLEKDILFLGKRDDIPSLLAVADIFVQPSLLDNQPLSVIEAQIAGKPLIVSDAGGLPEMVEHGRTGVISPAGDESALCLHLDYLLTHDEYRESLGFNAKKWALSHWSIETAVKQLLDVYQRTLSKK